MSPTASPGPIVFAFLLFFKILRFLRLRTKRFCLFAIISSKIVFKYIFISAISIYSAVSNCRGVNY